MTFLIKYLPIVAFGVFIVTLVVVRVLFRPRRRIEVGDNGLVVDRTFAFGWPDIRRLDFWIERGVARYVIHLGASKYAFTHREATLDDPLKLKHMIIERSKLQKEGNGRVETFVRHGDTGRLPASLLSSLPRPSRHGVVAASVGAAVLWMSHAKWVATAISLVASAGAYGWISQSVAPRVKFGMNPWTFALATLGVVLIHELGHAWVMRVHGLRAGAPIFIPFVGALIALRDQPRDAMVESEVGYGGPLAGAIASTVCYVIFYVTRDPNWLLVAFLGYALNLFNLLPVLPLDGGRIVAGISTRFWMAGVAVIVAVFALTWRDPRMLAINTLLLAVASFGVRDAIKAWREPRRLGPEKYYDVPTSYRIAMALAYVLLGAFLAWMVFSAAVLLGPFMKVGA